MWLGLFVLASLVLLLASLINIWLEYKAGSAEILGFVWTILRDSRFVELDPGMQDMDGTQVIKETGKRRVIYGVVGIKQDGKSPVLGA